MGIIWEQKGEPAKMGDVYYKIHFFKLLLVVVVEVIVVVGGSKSITKQIIFYRLQRPFTILAYF